IDSLLAMFAAIIIPLLYLLLKVFGRRMRPLARQLQEEHAIAIAIAEENLSMLPAIKTFTREQQESQRYRNQIERVVSLSAKERAIHAALGPGVQLVTAAAVVVMLWLAQGQIGDGA
ncbi:ABC transporter transmembrane domain-containing protein, partial [Mesorhizobium prunaredense]|uniref:ABC transporter transmembrane domain-containing protein n=1 Tax=Mesorhizobium prunaredense TaxID=1631249 RepID=UPI001AED07F5